MRLLVYIINYDNEAQNNNYDNKQYKQYKQYKHINETLKCNPSPHDFWVEPKLSQDMRLESFCKVKK